MTGRRPPGWWLAAGAVAFCLAVMVLRPLVQLGPTLPAWFHLPFRRLVHAVPAGFVIALVALLSIDPRSAAADPPEPARDAAAAEDAIVLPPVDGSCARPRRGWWS